MKTLIVGTCGHIDHGKTSLIKALTGVDADRLKEEKARGITIDLGYADYILPSKNRVAFVDVPGHEKFVKNMIAGITGVSLAMIIISAEDGIMPQTIEHFGIIKGLAIEKCVVVITKCDKSNDEVIELIYEEVKELLKGSPFENSKIIKTSAKTKEGIKDLIDYFEEEIKLSKSELDEDVFRMNIDRVFTINGAGTVVTGTIIEGEVNLGDNLFLYPENIEVKARGIQGYGENTKKLTKGNRCAINLSGVSKEEIKRGDVLSLDKNLKTSFIVDCKLNIDDSLDKKIKDRQRVRFYVGTKEVIGRIHLLNDDYIQVRLEEEIISKKGDNYYIRNFSPIYNIGGGKIIEPNAKKAKGDKEKYLDSLKLKEKGSLEENILKELLDIEFLFKEDLIKKFNSKEEIEKALEKLVHKDLVVILSKSNKNIIFSRKRLDKIESEAFSIIKEYHKKNPLDKGISKEELRKKLTKKEINKNDFNIFIDYLSENLIESSSGIIYLKDFKKRLSLNQKNFKKELLEELDKGFVPLNLNELYTKHNIKEEDKNKLLNYLNEENEVILLNDGVILTKDTFNFGIDEIYKHFRKNKTLSLGECRDILKTNRKIALSFLEELDNRKITKRGEKDRVLL